MATIICIHAFNAGIVFRRQNLMSRFRRHIPTSKDGPRAESVKCSQSPGADTEVSAKFEVFFISHLFPVLQKSSGTVCGKFMIVLKNALYFCVKWSTKVHNQAKHSCHKK